MRELSAQERAFLDRNLPQDSELRGSSSARRRSRSSIGSRLSQTVGSLLRYLPLAVGMLTLAVAGLSIYIYFWGRDFFKVSEVERMSNDGTLGLMDTTSGGWLKDILQVFSAAPWIILGTIVAGILLMGLSMLLVRKRKDG